MLLKASRPFVRASTEIGCIITFTLRWPSAFSVLFSHCDILARYCMRDYVGVAGK